MKYASAVLLLASFSSLAFCQGEAVSVRIHAVFVDKDLNQKPVPRLSVNLTPLDEPSAAPVSTRTSFDGLVDIRVAPGRYRLSTPDGIEFQESKYSWEMDIAVPPNGLTVELSNDNAKRTAVTSEKPAPLLDDLAVLFKKYQNSVVTVWSEFGHGSGFVIDASGLILTNQHVIGPSQYIAVQFDEKRKVEAKLVAFDAEKDIAVLWANLAAFPDAIVAPIVKTNSGDAVVEGERVFTIGSPLNQQKILTTGIVSKVEPHAILSDVKINHGNSGGPLFTAAGKVAGITTFADQDISGPGISGIVRIEEVGILLDRARTKMRDMTPPQPTLLPVEPIERYPVGDLKRALRARKFTARPYMFREGDYDVVIGTPVLKYQLSEGGLVAAERSKERREGLDPDAPQATFRPLEDLKSWEEYIGAYKPLIIVQASPQLRETSKSIALRSLVPYTRENTPATLKFRSDFYRMKLLCGDKEITPIQPGKIASVLNVHNPFISVTDATYQGFYSYPYDAISPDCGSVTLQIFSEKSPDKPASKVLDTKAIERIAEDFEPLRKAHESGGAAAQQ